MSREMVQTVSSLSHILRRNVLPLQIIQSLYCKYTPILFIYIQYRFIYTCIYIIYIFTDSENLNLHRSSVETNSGTKGNISLYQKCFQNVYFIFPLFSFKYLKIFYDLKTISIFFKINAVNQRPISQSASVYYSLTNTRVFKNNQ